MLELINSEYLSTSQHVYNVLCFTEVKVIVLNKSISFMLLL